MDNSFTHILCVKVWSPQIKMTSNYGNVLSIVKNCIIDTNIHFVSEINSKDTILQWRIKQFEEPYNQMFAGDLVANVTGDFDNKIYDLTKEMLKDIEERLMSENKLQNSEILFTIVKNIGL